MTNKRHTWLNFHFKIHQSDKTRYVFKIRLDPQVQQRNQFNTDGYDSPEVLAIVKEAQPWAGREYAKDAHQKLRFWRYLTGNDSLDRDQRYRN